MKEFVTHTADTEEPICMNCDNNDIGDEFRINECGSKHGWRGYERTEPVENE